MINVEAIIFIALIIEAVVSAYLAAAILRLRRKVERLNESKDNLTIHVASVLDGHSRATDRQTKATEQLVEIMRDVKQVLYDKNGQ